MYIYHVKHIIFFLIAVSVTKHVANRMPIKASRHKSEQDH